MNTKTQWRSGKISLRPDGVFIANLHAERGERNTFAIELFDPSGRKQKTSPDTLTYTIGAVVEEQPLINSMGIALANNEYDKLCEKGRGLPLKTTRDYRTTHAIRQGQSADVFKIPVIEGELDAPTETVLLVCWKSKGRTFAATCRQVAKSKSRFVLTSRAYHSDGVCPLLDEEFVTKLEMKKRDPDPEFLKRDFDAEMKRFREVKSKAADAEGETAEELVQQVEESPLMQDVKNTLRQPKATRMRRRNAKAAAGAKAQAR